MRNQQQHQEMEFERSAANFWLAAALLASGCALWIGALLRNPGALSMSPGLDGCLTVGVVGILLALLHGISYRTALLYLAVPIAAVQLAVTAGMGVSFFPMLGIELTAFGLFGLPLSRLPRRRVAERRAADHRGDAHPALAWSRPLSQDLRPAGAAAGRRR